MRGCKVSPTGTVDTWAEYHAAEENAREGGAVLVDNDLFVDFGPDHFNGDQES